MAHTQNIGWSLEELFDQDLMPIVYLLRTLIILGAAPIQAQGTVYLILNEKSKRNMLSVTYDDMYWGSHDS